MISAYQNEDTIGDFKVYPKYPNSGTVAFVSALHGWGFTLSHQSSIIGISGIIRKKNSIILVLVTFSFSILIKAHKPLRITSSVSLNKLSHSRNKLLKGI
jgi:hypothetical protein